MCFHSKQSKNAMAAEKRFNAIVADKLKFESSEHINGFTFPETPVITNDKPTTITNLNWGLIPSWARDNKIRQFTLNAKIETLTDKPSFRNSVNKRCLVLADGFYEWQWLDSKGKSKQKYLISLPNNELFAFAGIWSEWVDTTTQQVTQSYSIITTEAVGVMREIHNTKMRMPVILTPENEKLWLNNSPINNFVDVNVQLCAVKC